MGIIQKNIIQLYVLIPKYVIGFEKSWFPRTIINI